MAETEGIGDGRGGEGAWQWMVAVEVEWRGQWWGSWLLPRTEEGTSSAVSSKSSVAVIDVVESSSLEIVSGQNDIKLS